MLLVPFFASKVQRSFDLYKQCVCLSQVLTDSLVVNFHNLHHLFFIIRKLLKEVVTTNLISFKEDFKSANHVFHGGFLHQPCFEDLPDTSDANSGMTVDMKSWEKFCCSLSAVVWPPIVKCLKNGKELINSKSCQVLFFNFLVTFHSPNLFDLFNYLLVRFDNDTYCFLLMVLNFAFMVPSVSAWTKCIVSGCRQVPTMTAQINVTILLMSTQFWWYRLGLLASTSTIQNQPTQKYSLTHPLIMFVNHEKRWNNNDKGG